MYLFTIASLLAAAVPALTCDNCYGPRDDAAHVRNVRRQQPGAQNATDGPKGPLAWGQLNFIHTTDTHGWLEGHIKEVNYGADWGDFVSFTKHMQQTAGNLGVDLLIVDTGDLHDGNGDSDAETPDGSLSNPIFENIKYDVLTIGNHELYLSDVAYLTFNSFSKVYGERYLTSNVQIMNPTTGAFEYIGNQYRYFTTAHGLRIMSFGFLYDFTGNTNVTNVIKAAEVVTQSWFLDAVQFKKPIDLFLVLGHNPARPTAGGSTFGTYYKAIRALRPNTPIQIFGGHSHIRDFAVYDQGTTGIESGRYCETMGWVAMSGINSTTFTGNMFPAGVLHPTQKAVKVSSTTSTASATVPSPTGNSSVSSFSNMVYFRRYLDWNRLTFAYHSVGSQSSTFDYHSGLRVTQDITNLRNQLNLSALYGCAPATYCQYCKPFGTFGNIFNLLEIALGATVINRSRAEIPRYIIINSGSVRFDLVEGPFTYDDSFIVSPFTDAFQFIPNVPYNIASQVLAGLNGGPASKRRDLSTKDFGFTSLQGDSCVDATVHSHNSRADLKRRSEPMTRGLHRRQTSIITPGYVTTDDFGTDGDDTIHSKIPDYDQPEYIQGNASFPTNSTANPATLDLIFLDFIASDVLAVLSSLGAKYTMADVSYYLPITFTTNSYLPIYAKEFWQAGVPNCPVGLGVGY